jgi:hypothetical protein
MAANFAISHTPLHHHLLPPLAAIMAGTSGWIEASSDYTRDMERTAALSLY